MAAAPTPPITWTAIPATNPTVGPDLAYSVQSSGTLLAAPTAGALTSTGTELTPGATLTWVELAASDATMGPVLFASLDTTVAVYYYGRSLAIVEGA